MTKLSSRRPPFLPWFLFAILLSCPCTSMADQLGFSYDNVSGCSSSVASIGEMSFDCNANTGCTTGDEVTISGTFTTTLPIPDEVNIKVQICKFWGTLCTPYLLDQDVNFCGVLGMTDDAVSGDDEYYCVQAGTYPFESQFRLPDSSLSNSNFAINGVSFRIYVLINNEFTCHAQFTTVTISNSNVTVSMVGIVLVIASMLGVYQARKKRRLRTKAQIQLTDIDIQERQSTVIDFALMHNDNYVHMDSFVSL